MRQKESGRRLFLAAGFLALSLGAGIPAAFAQGGNSLSTGGLTFRDFGTADNGASFAHGQQSIGGGTTNRPGSTRLLGVDSKALSARVQFQAIKVDMTLPMGWEATEDWERGLAFSVDKRYRAVVWRVDFEFEGVKDAEHYAATKAGAIKARRPGVQSQARKLPDGSLLVVYENVPKGQGETEPRTVFDLVVPNPRNVKAGVLLTLGVPASDSARGLNLLALLKQNMQIDWQYVAPKQQ
ncbi:MAG: hypothetical protein IKE60_13280 [Reyranella sp.]|uniref:hypothetical protein n=1 Tax=Reyranella sp. TaxID=1929291 RepID=UPI0025F5BDD9|nr:hypothetical protein [Reyranella sp.]MBR2815618.1 hypothetical protein [Reyranella sp.]